MLEGRRVKRPMAFVFAAIALLIAGLVLGVIGAMQVVGDTAYEAAFSTAMLPAAPPREHNGWWTIAGAPAEHFDAEELVGEDLLRRLAELEPSRVASLEPELAAFETPPSTQRLLERAFDAPRFVVACPPLRATSSTKEIRCPLEETLRAHQLAMASALREAMVGAPKQSIAMTRWLIAASRDDLENTGRLLPSVAGPILLRRSLRLLPTRGTRLSPRPCDPSR